MKEQKKEYKHNWIGSTIVRYDWIGANLRFEALFKYV